MAQFGDRKPASFRGWAEALGRSQAKLPGPSSPLPQPGADRSTADSSRPSAPDSPSLTRSGSQVAPDQFSTDHTESRGANAALLSRRRNQWRQYKHMTFDVGPRPVAPHSGSMSISPPAIEAKPKLTMPRLPDRPPTARPVPRSGLLPPTQTGAKVTPLAPVPPSRTRVTPLPTRLQSEAPRPLRSRQRQPTPGLEAVATTPRPGLPRRARPPAPPLPRAPRSVLYLMRLLILGVGVAAIAGTLLAALSPAKQDTASPEPPSLALAPTDAGRVLVAGRPPGQVDDLRLGQPLARLKAQLEQLVTLTPGLSPALFSINLDTGNYVELQGSQALPAASTIKVPILVAFLQQVDAGTLALNQTLALRETQIASGSGTLANDAIGTEYSALEVASRMIITSDNTATNMIIDALGGMEALNQKFAEWGLTATVLRNPLPDLEGTNTTSTRDLAMLMALLDQGGLLSPRSRDRLFSIMQRTVNRSLIPTGIGKPDGTIVANKTGDIATVLGDVALVDTANGHRYAVALLVQRPGNDGRASELIRRLTEITHTEINQPLSPVGRPADPVAPPLPAVDAEVPTDGTAPTSLESQPQPVLPSDFPSPGQSGDTVPPG